MNEGAAVGRGDGGHLDSGPSVLDDGRGRGGCHLDRGHVAASAYLAQTVNPEQPGLAIAAEGARHPSQNETLVDSFFRRRKNHIFKTAWPWPKESVPPTTA